MGEVAKNKVKLKEVLKEATGELIILSDFKETAAELKAVVKKHSKLIVSEENLDSAKQARLEIREYRYSLQNLLKHNKGFLNKAKEKLEEDTEKLISILTPEEDRIHSSIRDIETKKEREKEEERKREEERVNKISSAIQKYETLLRGLVLTANDKESLSQLEEELEKLQSDIKEEVFDEFNFEAIDLHESMTNQKSVILERIKEREFQEKERIRLAEERKKLDAEKAEYEAWRKEKEEAEKAEAEKKAKEEAEKKANEEEELRKKNLEQAEKLKAEEEKKSKELESQRIKFKLDVSKASAEIFDHLTRRNSETDLVISKFIKIQEEGDSSEYIESVLNSYKAANNQLLKATKNELFLD